MKHETLDEAKFKKYKSHLLFFITQITNVS